MKAEYYHKYTMEDLTNWAMQEPARRFQVRWLSRPRSTPLTSRGGYEVTVWSNRTKTKANGHEPIVHRGRSWELNMAIRKALASYGVKL